MSAQDKNSYERFRKEAAVIKHKIEGIEAEFTLLMRYVDIIDRDSRLSERTKCLLLHDIRERSDALDQKMDFYAKAARP